nr:hypothetical protein [Tanacetum cinerariifolium]
MEIPDVMISDAIKKSVGYYYYIAKKKESAKDKIVDEPKEQRLSPIKSGKGKGFMCYGDQAVNVLKKDVVPRKMIFGWVIDTLRRKVSRTMRPRCCYDDRDSHFRVGATGCVVPNDVLVGRCDFISVVFQDGTLRGDELLVAFQLAGMFLCGELCDDACVSTVCCGCSNSSSESNSK